MNIQRLEKLIEVLTEVKPEAFDMDYWTDDRDCGTVACAAGYAASYPWFIKRGFLFEPDLQCPMDQNHDNATGFAACQSFFDLAPDASYYLFDPDWYGRNRAPKDVIERVKNLIAWDGEVSPAVRAACLGEGDQYQDEEYGEK